jgi:hypothetical protein
MDDVANDEYQNIVARNGATFQKQHHVICATEVSTLNVQ